MRRSSSFGSFGTLGLFLAAIAAAVLLPLADGAVAAPTFSVPSAANTDTSAAIFTLFADSAGAANETALIQLNGVTETTAVLGGDATFDSRVDLTGRTGAFTFRVIPDTTPADSAVRTLYRADSPTTISLSSPVALAGVAQFRGNASGSISAGSTTTVTVTGTIFDVGVDTPVNVFVDVQNSTGTVVVNDSALAVTGGNSFSGRLVFLSDSVGGNTITVFANDTAAPIFGDTKQVIFTLSVSQVTQTNSAPVQSFTDPTDTTTTVEPNPSTTLAESYVQIALDSGGRASTTTASPTFSSLADETGTRATHTVHVVLAGDETATLHIYTGRETMAVLVSNHEVIYEGQGSLYGGAILPDGVADNSNLLQGFDATVLSILFAESSGRLMTPDSRTIVDVGDTLAYTICWTLSETVTRFFRAAGFDTRAGSGDFGVWAAETFAGRWQHLKQAVARVGGNTMTVCGVGLTKDVHLGLAHAQGASPTGGDGGTCLLERSAAPRSVLRVLRLWRDRFLATFLGRLFATLYYLL